MSESTIKDLPKTEEISEDELEKVSGGLNVSSLGVKQSSLISAFGAVTSPIGALINPCGNAKMATGQAAQGESCLKGNP